MGKRGDFIMSPKEESFEASTTGKLAYGSACCCQPSHWYVSILVKRTFYAKVLRRNLYGLESLRYKNILAVVRNCPPCSRSLDEFREVPSYPSFGAHKVRANLANVNTYHLQVRDLGNFQPPFKHLRFPRSPFLELFRRKKKKRERWYCSFEARSIGKAENRRKLKAACRRQ